MALPFAGLAALRGGLMPPGMSLGAGIGQLAPAAGAAGAAGALSAPSASSLNVAPASAPAAPSYAPNPYTNGTGGANAGNPYTNGTGGANAGGGTTGGGTTGAPISPAAVGAAITAAAPTAAFGGSGSTRDQNTNINPYTSGTGGANAGYSAPPLDRSFSPYAPGIGRGAGDYIQNRPEISGPSTMDDLMNTLPGAPQPTAPNYDPGYYMNPGSPQRVADASNSTIGTNDSPPSWLGGTGGTSGINQAANIANMQTPSSVPAPWVAGVQNSVNANPNIAASPVMRTVMGQIGVNVPSYPGGTLTPADSQAAPFMSGGGGITGAQGPGISGIARERLDAATAARPVPAGTPLGGYEPAPPPVAAGTYTKGYDPLTSGTGGANRGGTPAPYLDPTGVAEEVFSGPDIAPAAPAPAPAPSAPINPFAGLGDFFSPPSQQAIDQMAGGYGVAPPVSSTPGFLEAGGASHSTLPSYGLPRPPQARPPSGPSFGGNLPQARPSLPYSDTSEPRVPQARPNVGINPFGLRNPYPEGPRMPRPRPPIGSDADLYRNRGYY